MSSSLAAAGHPDDARVVATIRQGTPYRYVFPLPAHARGCCYRVLQFSKCGRTGQDQVLHIGLEGEDEGQIFTCNLVNFAVRFEEVVSDGPPAPEPEKAQPLPEKKFYFKEGPGY